MCALLYKQDVGVCVLGETKRQRETERGDGRPRDRETERNRDRQMELWLVMTRHEPTSVRREAT